MKLVIQARGSVDIERTGEALDGSQSIDFKQVPAGVVRDHPPHQSVTDACMGL
jgi:hypothetical protein